MNKGAGTARFAGAAVLRDVRRSLDGEIAGVCSSGNGYVECEAGEDQSAAEARRGERVTVGLGFV